MNSGWAEVSVFSMVIHDCMVLPYSRGRQAKLAFNVTGLSHVPISSRPHKPFLTRVSSMKTDLRSIMHALHLLFPTF